MLDNGRLAVHWQLVVCAMDELVVVRIVFDAPLTVAIVHRQSMDSMRVHQVVALVTGVIRVNCGSVLPLLSVMA